MINITNRDSTRIIIFSILIKTSIWFMNTFVQKSMYLYLIEWINLFNLYFVWTMFQDINDLHKYNKAIDHFLLRSFPLWCRRLRVVVHGSKRKMNKFATNVVLLKSRLWSSSWYLSPLKYLLEDLPFWHGALVLVYILCTYDLISHENHYEDISIQM